MSSNGHLGNADAPSGYADAEVTSSSASNHDPTRDPRFPPDDGSRARGQPPPHWMYRLMAMRLEQDRTSWGQCCKCGNSGEIMSWPRCKRCRHHCCPSCEYELDRTAAVDTAEQAGGGSTASSRIDKMNELSGEICLELEALEAVETLTAPQTHGVARGWEIIRSLNQWLEEMEDGGNEDARPAEAA